MRQTNRKPRTNMTTARTPLDMDISALLRSAQSLEKSAQELSKMDHDEAAAQELEVALRHNRQIWSVFMGDALRGHSHLNSNIKQTVPALGSEVLQQTRELEAEKSSEALQKLVDVNRTLASDLQRSKAA